VQHLYFLKGNQQGLRHQQFSTEELLPHIGQHLDLGKTQFDGVRALGSFWELDRIMVDGIKLNSDGWICSIRGSDERSKAGIPFSLQRPQIVVLRTGIAFLSLEIQPVRNDSRDWLDLAHYLRFTVTGRERSLLHRESGVETTISRLFEGMSQYLRPEGALPLNLGPRVLRHERDQYFMEAIDSAELLTYGSVFFDGLDAEHDLELRERVRSGFHSRQGIDLTDEWYHAESLEHRLPYQYRQAFEITTASSFFVGFDLADTQFTKNNLPAHFRQIYLLLFLLVHSQRLALSALSREVYESVVLTSTPANGQRLADQLNQIVELDRRLLEFTGSAYFLKVTQQQHHHSYYTKLRTCIQMQLFYQEVKEELASLRIYISSLVQREADRRANLLQVAVAALTAVFVPAGVLLALFAPKIPDWPVIRELSPDVSTAITIGVLMTLGSSLFFFRSLVKRKDRG